MIKGCSSELEALMQKGIGFVQSALSDLGAVWPTIVYHTKDGKVNFINAEIDNADELPDFASRLKMLFVAHDVVRYVFFCESTVALINETTGETAETQDAVSMLGGERGHNLAYQIEVIRDDGGNIIHVGEPQRYPDGEFEGEFARLIPDIDVADTHRRLCALMVEKFFSVGIFREQARPTNGTITIYEPGRQIN